MSHQVVMQLRAALAVLFAGLAPVTIAAAMTVERHGDTVFATGAVGDDLPAFERAFAEGPVRRVVFVDSPGGDLWSGMRVGRLLASQRVETVVAGACISSCGIMFMGGQERRFADALPPGRTLVGLHGAHRTATRQVDSGLQPQIFAWFKERMGERFDSEVVNRALYDMEDHGALLRVFDPSRTPKPVTTHCRSRQTPRSQCTELKEHDAVTLGIITHAGAVTVDLPARFRPIQRVFGRDLGEPIADETAWLQDLARQACRDDNCSRLLLEWPTRRPHWAVAVGQRGGFGRVEGRESPELAAIGAIYRCNHRGDAAHLCELQGVSGARVQEPGEQLDRLHAGALADLRPPGERTYANEEFGGERASESVQLRTQRMNDITPSKLPGVGTIFTGELATMLSGAARPVVIDVSSLGESIPGSWALWNGGRAFDDSKVEQALGERFTRLLALLAPDRGAPVVFYGSSQEFWDSANAARRAAASGWQRVLWYRGGLQAWRAAGLAVAPARVRAVAY